MPDRKALIISMFSKRETSYVEHYKSVLENCGQEYDIIYFERYGESDTIMSNEFVFSGDCPTGGSKLKKLKPMIAYACFIRAKVSKGNYDRLIVLTTVPAVMLGKQLVKRYKNRFILDVRDYTYESIGVYRKKVARIVDSSYATVLSSRGFLDFMPHFERYYITHNIAREYDAVRHKQYFSNEVINVGFVGSVRYFAVNSKMCDVLGNDADYRLSYHGTHAADCNLESYCLDKGYRGVTFTGRFNNEDKARIYSDIDIINGVYDTEMKETLRAVPNRFYDAAIYKCPIIVSKGTYLEELVNTYGIGFAVDIRKDDLKQLLDTYLSTFDVRSFELGCNNLLEDVSYDIRNQEEMIRDWLLDSSD